MTKKVIKKLFFIIKIDIEENNQSSCSHNGWHCLISTSDDNLMT